MNLLLQDLRHLGNSVGFDKDVPEIDNITKRDVKSMNKIAYIRQAVEKAIKPKEKHPDRGFFAELKKVTRKKPKLGSRTGTYAVAAKRILTSIFGSDTMLKEIS